MVFQSKTIFLKIYLFLLYVSGVFLLCMYVCLVHLCVWCLGAVMPGTGWLWATMLGGELNLGLVDEQLVLLAS